MVTNCWCLPEVLPILSFLQVYVRTVNLLSDEELKTLGVTTLRASCKAADKGMCTYLYINI